MSDHDGPSCSVVLLLLGLFWIAVILVVVSTWPSP